MVPIKFCKFASASGLLNLHAPVTMGLPLNLAAIHALRA
jgi:hypothetical protein